MKLRTDHSTAETVLHKIDGMVDELVMLRRLVQTLLSMPAPAPEDDLPSVLDVIEGASGHRVFHNASEVTQYLREERAAWDS